MTSRPPSLFRRTVAALLSALLAFGPVADPAYAALTKLADKPLNVQNSAPPNIVMTIDDSTSMLSDFLPDHAIQNWCRDGTGSATEGAMVASCGKEPQGSADNYPSAIWHQPNVPYNKYDDGNTGFVRSPVPPFSGWPDPPSPAQYWPAPVHNSDFNRIYYNPRITYEVPLDADGTPWPSMNAVCTKNWGGVPADPFKNSRSTACSALPQVSLTESVTIGQWCLSDWVPAGTAYQENQNICRTNGTGSTSAAAAAVTTTPTYPKFAASVMATSSSPYPNQAANGDYIYPFPPTTKPGTDTTRFFRNADKDNPGNNIYCDTTNANYPTVNGTTCTGYGVVTQSCNLKSSAVSPTCTASTGKCNLKTSGSAASCALKTAASTGACNLSTAALPGTCSLKTAVVADGSCIVGGGAVADGTCAVKTATVANGSCTLKTAAGTCNGTISSNTCSYSPKKYKPAGCDPACVGSECGPCVEDKTAPCYAYSCVGGTNAGTACSGLSDTSTCTAGYSCTGGASPGATCSGASDTSTCKGSAATYACSGGAAPGATCSGTTDTSTCKGAATTYKCSGGANPNKACSGLSDASTCKGTAATYACTSGSNPGTTCSGTSDTTTCKTKAAVYKCVGGSNAGTTCTGTTDTTTCKNQLAVYQCTGGSNPGTVCTGTTDTTTCKSTSNVYACSGGAQNGAACTGTTDTTTCTTSYSCSAGVNVGKTCTTGTVATDCPGTAAAYQCYSAGAFTGVSCNIANGATKNPACPDLPGACNQYNQLPVAAACTTALGGTMTAQTMRQDADANGVVCRHNNGGTGYTAGPFTYPSGKYTTKATCADAYAPALVQAPRHYWKTGVQWCKTQISTAAGGDKWAGYGNASTAGNCQSFRDSDHTYPSFYQFESDPATFDSSKTPAFERVDLHPARAPFVTTWTADDGTLTTVSRTYAQEMENYANWFAYYRTRIQAVQTATSLVFKEIDDKFRVGFHTLSNVPKATFLTIKPFDATQKSTWFSNLFGLNLQLGTQTPTIDALQRVGDWFTNGSSSDLSGATDPIDPTLTCQKNWHMLFTDGQTNQKNLPKVTVGNTDKTVPTLPEDLSAKGLVTGDPWPPFYRENSSGIANSLSDYVTYYWTQDLRPSMKNNVPGTDLDPAIWQHMNFAALSFGTEGKLPAGNQSVVESQIKAGTLSWPPVSALICPTCATAPQAPQQPDESGIDDLWHAAINGRGRFVNAQSVDELRLGMGQILADIQNQPGSRAGAALVSPSFTATNKFIYRVAFQPGWGGSVTKVEIDPTTGKEVKEIWRAADQLTTQLTVVPGVKDNPWQTERRVVTINDTTNAAVPFLWANLSASQQDSLAPGNAARGQLVLKFLRGDQSHEGSRLGQFRQRVGGPIGDIVNSQAVVIGPPVPLIGTGVAGIPAQPIFLDAGYADYFAAQSTRPTRVYVGANDGLLHAFDDATGNESWAFVPKGIFRSDTTGLRGLVLQDGGLPPFYHHYYVDGPSRVTDVDFGGGTKDTWHTILVGGLGKGGKSFYAIDVTNPAGMVDEASVAKKVLWEFTDSDMGYSYGKPLLAKTRAHGWVAVLTSGYNNPSGVGKVFFVKPETGKLLATLSTGAGDATTPSGLAQVSGYVQDFRDQTLEQLYGGDLLGNFWRFDVSNADTSKWKVEKLATFVNGGIAQPVTSPPQIEVDIRNGVDRWVFVGTGQLLDPSDLLDTHVQTMYALRDGTRTTPSTIKAVLTRTDLVEVKDAAGLTSKPDNGWYDDLKDATGQRIVVPPEADIGIVAYVTTEPPGTDPCLTGQPARIYAREFALGNSRLPGASAGSFDESYYSATGGVGVSFVSLLVPPGTPESATSYGLSLGLLVTRGDGTTVLLSVTLPQDLFSHRMSWRILSQ
jgi:type IV pilus assembly protein PilY1